jgi:hypothetical protein
MDSSPEKGDARYNETHAQITRTGEGVNGMGNGGLTEGCQRRGITLRPAEKPE